MVPIDTPNLNRSSPFGPVLKGTRIPIRVRSGKISSKNLLALTLSLSLKPLVRSFPDIAFSIFAGVAVINCLVRVHMKIEINRRASPRDRISWLAFDTKSEIVRKYRHLEPESALPSISRVTWWLCAVSFAGLISTIFLDR